MPLKPIPAEQEQKNARVKKQKKRTLLQSIRTKLGTKIFTHDKKILKDTTTRIVEFLTNEGSLTVDYLNSLINCLERSIMIVQKRKKALIEKDNKKLNKKRK